MNRRIAVLAVALAAPPLAAAASHPVADKIKLGEFVESISFGGDLRLRFDTVDRRSVPSNDRSRLRFRLRLASEATLPHRLSVVTRLATGTGEQVSTNQSFDNLGSQKQLWLDLVYAKWAPELPSERAAAAIASGKVPNNLWRIASSDLIWDDDYNPEGFSQSASWAFPELGASLFVNALQAVADEDSTSPRNQWHFSQQLGAELPLPLTSKLKLAGAYHKWTDEQRSSLSQAAAQDGNRKAGGVLRNRFGTGEVTAQVTAWAFEVPVILQGTVARNLRARGDIGADARDGYQYGVILGSAKTEGGVEVAAFSKRAEADVTVADVADSDFGEGGTNRRGGVFWVSWSPKSWMNLRAKYFTTKVLDRALATATLDANRAQLDWSVKF